MTSNSTSTAPLMSAIVQHGTGGPDVLRLEQMPRPVLLPTEVLVRVRAAGINPVDWKSREGGGMAAALGDGPFVPGWDIAGVVEAVGFGVTTLRPGDEVFGMPRFPRRAGAYAEYATAPSRQLARIPAGLDPVSAAALPLAALTARQSLVDAAHVEAGQRVLVHGASGGVGHLAVQIAAALGAHVIASARPALHDWLRELGAADAIDRTDPAAEAALAPVDAVVDFSGRAHQGPDPLAVLRDGGRYVAATVIPAPVAQAAVARGIAALDIMVEPDGAGLAEIARLVADGALRVEVAGTAPLAEAAALQERSAEGRTRGKLVLVVDPEA